MKAQCLATFLILGMFSQLCWAPPPGKGGATGGAASAPDLSLDIKKCNLIPRSQTKMKAKERSGRERFICTGLADCEGKQIPVICEASEKGACPTAKECVEPAVAEEVLDLCKVNLAFWNDGTNFEKFMNDPRAKCAISIQDASYDHQPPGGAPPRRIRKIFYTITVPMVPEKYNPTDVRKFKFSFFLNDEIRNNWFQVDLRTGNNPGVGNVRYEKVDTEAPGAVSGITISEYFDDNTKFKLKFNKSNIWQTLPSGKYTIKQGMEGTFEKK